VYYRASVQYPFFSVNMLSGRFYSQHQLIFVTRLSRYFLILILILFFVFKFSFVLLKLSVRLKSVDNK
jgi:hypothetical protein